MSQQKTYSVTAEERAAIEQFVAAQQAYIVELRGKVRHLRRVLETLRAESEMVEDLFAGADPMTSDPAVLRHSIEKFLGVTAKDDSDVIPPARPRASRTQEAGEAMLRGFNPKSYN